MARTTTLENIERKITEKQLEVASARKAYEKRMEELRVLMDKRDALRNEKLLEVIVESGRPYEEILAFLRNLKEEK